MAPAPKQVPSITEMVGSAAKSDFSARDIDGDGELTGSTEVHVESGTPASLAGGRRMMSRSQQDAERRAQKWKDDRTVANKYRFSSGLASVDWRSVLMTLRNTTIMRPGPHELDTIEMKVAEEDAHKILTVEGESIWEIADHFECDFSLSPRPRDPQHRRTLIVHGGAQAVTVAKSVIESILARPPDKAAPPAPPFGRYTIGFREAYRLEKDWSGKNIRPLPVSPWRAFTTSLPYPPEWTSNSLMSYVRELCPHPFRPTHLRHTRDAKYQALRAIYAVLITLVRDASVRDSFTPRVINLVLTFFLRHGQVDCAHDFRRALDHQHVRMNVESHNTLLRHAASSKKLLAFRYELGRMLERGHRPNSATWVAFMMNDLPLEVRRGTLNTMKSLGLLRQPKALQDAVAHVVDGDAAEWADADKTAMSLVEALDRLHGHEWRSTTGVNRIVEEYGKRGRIRDGLDVCEWAADRGVRMDEVGVHMMLKHCQRQESLRLVVPVVQFAERRRIRLDDKIYTALFELAWKRSRYNLARIVWSFACVDRATSRAMRVRLVDSLDAVHPPLGDNVRHYFVQSVGKVIVGIQTPRSAAEITARQHVRRLVCRDDLHAPGNQRLRQEARAVKMKLLNRDLCGHVRLTRPDRRPGAPSRLSARIEEALALDTEWLKSGMMHEASALEKASQVIEPNFERRTGEDDSDKNTYSWYYMTGVPHGDSTVSEGGDSTVSDGGESPGRVVRRLGGRRDDRGGRLASDTPAEGQFDETSDGPAQGSIPQEEENDPDLDPPLNSPTDETCTTSTGDVRVHRHSAGALDSDEELPVSERTQRPEDTGRAENDRSPRQPADEAALEQSGRTARHTPFVTSE